MKLLLIIFAMLAGIFAWATPEVPTDATQVLALIPEVMKALNVKNWTMLAALVILIGVWALRTYVLPKDGSHDDKLPIYSAIIGVLVSVAGYLYEGTGTWYQAVLSGIFVGNAASGFWDMLVSRLVKKPTPELPLPEGKVKV